MVGGVKFEHGHRMVAEFVGLLTICLAIWTWRSEKRRWMKFLGLAAIATVIAQGILGGITVLFYLPPAISSAHDHSILHVNSVFDFLLDLPYWSQP